MKPPKREKTDFEKVTTEDFTTCTIEDIAYDLEHKFKGFQGAEDKVKPAVRFKFKVDGYKYHHYSRWMSFNFGEKSNLFLKYLVPLVDGAAPDMDFDLDALKGVKIKVLWAEKNEFQFPETIRPIGKKLSPKTLPVIDVDDDEPPVSEHDEWNPDEEIPF